ncbi:MAG TPA: molybdate ABC transporter permease subunit [Chroococcales cyanobacterium]
MIDTGFSLTLSLVVATLATLIVGVLGTGLGYILARCKFFGHDLLDAICSLPLVLPPTVVGFFLLEILGRHGVIGAPVYRYTGWTLVFTWQAAVIAAVVVSLPFMIKTSRAAIESVDRTYENVAFTLGKSEMETAFKVTLPLAWKGLLAGIALSFARALGEFGATVMVAGNIPERTQTMPLAIYQAVQNGNEQLVFGLVSLLTVISVAVLFSLNRLGARW